MRNRCKKAATVVLFAVLAAVCLLSLSSCGSAVDIGEVTKLLTSVALAWPDGFDLTCPCNKEIEVTVRALDQSGKVFAWSGYVDVWTENTEVGVNPPSVLLLTGTKEFTLTFSNFSTEDQVTNIILQADEKVFDLNVSLRVLAEGNEIPKDVIASDGVYRDKVRVGWSAVTGAESYDVYRSTQDVGTYTFIGRTDALIYDDTSAVGTYTYYYKVCTHSSIYGDSDLSGSGSGFKRNYQFELKWGSRGSLNGEFEFPYGIAIDANGFVYVSERDNNRVQVFDSQGVHQDTWGGVAAGTEDGEFERPWGIATHTVDTDTYVYVADRNNHRIQKFSPGGTHLATWGGVESQDEGLFRYPEDVAVDAGGNVYVADTWNSRIQKFDSGGTLLDIFETTWINSIAVDAAGNMYVVNGADHLVLKYDGSGTLLTSWGGFGPGDNELNTPCDIFIDPDGYLYVPESGNHRIMKYDSNGNLLAKVGSLTQSEEDGKFLSPQGVALDEEGRMYVADSSNFRVQRFTPDIMFMDKWGTQGSGDGQFESPLGVEVDGDGYVYVADTDNHRIQKFDPDGNHLATWGSYEDVPGSDPTVNPGKFNKPHDIAVDADGNLYVADKDNFRIQKFDPYFAPVAQWGGLEPYGVSVGADGFVYVGCHISSFQYAVKKYDASGNFITQWGYYGVVADEQIGGIAWGMGTDRDGGVYVVDYGQYWVKKFDSDGGFLGKWGGGIGSEGEGCLFHPRGLAADAFGNTYVAGGGKCVIHKYDPDGVFLEEWGESGSGDGQLSVPSGVCVTSDGLIYVADTVNHRIQKFGVRP